MIRPVALGSPRFSTIGSASWKRKTINLENADEKCDQLKRFGARFPIQSNRNAL
jgi:hypothetical protein